MRNKTKGFIIGVIVAVVVGILLYYTITYWDHLQVFFQDVGKYFERVDEEIGKTTSRYVFDDQVFVKSFIEG